MDTDRRTIPGRIYFNAGRDVNDTLLATKPERVIYSVLTKMGIQFTFQSKFFGGRTVRGGIIADFYLPTYSLVISVLGEYYHYEKNRLAIDILQRTALEGDGIHVIFIDEEDALKNPKYYIEEAIRGFDHSKLGKM